MTTREEHLEWCRSRALEYLDQGEVDKAFASFVSDLSKMPEGEDETDPDGNIRWLSSAATFAEEGFQALLDGDRHRVRQMIEAFQ